MRNLFLRSFLSTYVYIAITCICIGFLSFKGNNDGNKTFVKIDLSFSTPKRDFSFFLLFEAWSASVVSFRKNSADFLRSAPKFWFARQPPSFIATRVSRSFPRPTKRINAFYDEDPLFSGKGEKRRKELRRSADLFPLKT